VKKNVAFFVLTVFAIFSCEEKKNPGSSVEKSYKYDQKGRLVEERLSNGAETKVFIFEYDSNDNILSVREARGLHKGKGRPENQVRLHVAEAHRKTY